MTIPNGTRVLVTQTDDSDGDPPTPPYEGVVSSHNSDVNRYEVFTADKGSFLEDADIVRPL